MASKEFGKSDNSQLWFRRFIELCASSAAPKLNLAWQGIVRLKPGYYSTERA